MFSVLNIMTPIQVYFNASSSGLSIAWFAGARYYFSDNFAVMAEIGYGVAYLNLGIALKF